MNFLVDAHLPLRLALAIRAEGYDVKHTLDLPDANKTTDRQINELSEQEKRALITKDADFVNSLLISSRPYKLLLISMDNISNNDLEALFMPQLSKIVEIFHENRFLELNRDLRIIHS